MSEKKHGDFGYEKNSTWHQIMTEGTAQEKADLQRWLDDNLRDAAALEAWARQGFTSGRSDLDPDLDIGTAEDNEVPTPDVDAYLQRRGYDPKGEDE